MKAHLVISIPLEIDDKYDTYRAINLLILINACFSDDEKEKAKVALTRDGDRSGGNLLLEQLDGRFETHYQGRKAKLSEIIND